MKVILAANAQNMKREEMAQQPTGGGHDATGCEFFASVERYTVELRRLIPGIPASPVPAERAEESVAHPSTNGTAGSLSELLRP
jgi:hypothetical protein